jgi:hypothetical protein
MSVRMIIRAVPERIEFVQYLKARLPNAEFCMDRKKDAMQTFFDALDMAGDGPAVHMEEDILLCENFEKRLNEEVTRYPNNLIQFFSMRKDDLTVGSRWDRKYMMNQCFYLPAGYSRELRKYWNVWPKRHVELNGFDIMIADWLNTRREPYWIHVPSLVQHRECVSVINHRRSSKRQSFTFKHAPGEEHLK